MIMSIILSLAQKADAGECVFRQVSEEIWQIMVCDGSVRDLVNDDDELNVEG